MSGERRDAAVMLAVHRGPAPDARQRLLFVLRGRGGRHGGQLALPGGNREPGDADLQATAIRETAEELGAPPVWIEVVASLDPIDSATTGYRVQPFLARFLADPARCRPSGGEVEAVVALDVAELADPAALGREQKSFPTWPAPRTVPVRRAGGHTVWGLTLRIVEPVLPHLLDGTWPL